MSFWGLFTAQELTVLRKLQPTEDTLDVRLNNKLQEDADISVSAIFRTYLTPKLLQLH
jgi:hypothetical protein